MNYRPQLHPDYVDRGVVQTKNATQRVNLSRSGGPQRSDSAAAEQERQRARRVEIYRDLYTMGIDLFKLVSLR